MICPKCGFEQPDGVDCARCGIVFSRYKGAPAGPRETPPAFVPPPPPPSPAWPPPPPVYPAADVFGGPPPPPPAADPFYSGPFDAAATADTFYQGPTDAAEAGSTLYEGPPTPVPPRPGTIYGGPTSPGTTVRRTARPIDFSVFGILGQTFSIYLRNIIPFLAISIIVVLPVFFLLYYFANSLLAKLPAQAVQPGMDLRAMVGGLTVVMAAILSAPFATAALTYGVFQEMRKREGTILDCLRVGLTSVFSVLGVVIVQGILIILAMIACFILGIALVAVLPPALGGLLLLFLVVVTLAYLFVVFSVSVPAAVEERPGVFEALRRSSYLTAGHRWAVLGVLFVLLLINQGLGKALEKAFQNPISRDYLTAAAGWQLVVTGLSATAAAVMYYKLRGADESINVEDIASVFD